MADLYCQLRCDGCGKLHDLYDTSAVRHRTGSSYQFTCPASGLSVTIVPTIAPEVVEVLPDDAVPLDWVG